jgi:DNA-binding CsgD family transcriptional regulator
MWSTTSTGDAEGVRRLVGRDSERAVLRQLLETVRGGGSRALVVLGEAGIGKTALLRDLAEQASDLRVVSVSGVESEMELPFAALHQLCAPLLDRIDAVPEPQALALRITFGMNPGPTPDRLLVGLAVLSLLAESAAEKPLLAVVDDEQWLDRASAQAMAFAARRLGAESVGLVFGTRAPGIELDGLPRLAVEGLGRQDACALLDSALTIRVDRRVRDQMVTETHGNPLALVELPREVAAAQLAGGFGLPGAFEVPHSAEEMFRRRTRSLPDEAGRLLLLAAAEPTGDPALLWRAAELLGIRTTAARALADAGLAEFGARVRFRHPLVRSAAYRNATGEQRQQVHAALAQATDPVQDPDRRAWHRAQAASGCDEDVAQALEDSAGRARARGGLGAAAAFLEHAALLTPDAAVRTRRAVAAARAKIQAGELETAQDLITIAERCIPGESDRAHVGLVRAQLAFATGRGHDVPAQLLAAADRLGPLDPSLARTTYFDAIRAAVYVGRYASSEADLLAVARAIDSASREAGAAGEADPMLEELAAGFPRAHDVPQPVFIRAMLAIGGPGADSDQEMVWLWMACFAASGVWDYERWRTFNDRYVALCRERGALAELQLALSARTHVLLVGGEAASADSVVEEVRAAVSATGSNLVPYAAVARAAFRGEQSTVSDLVQAVVSDARGRGEGLAVTAAEWADALLNNGLGRYRRALAAAQRATEYAPEDLGLRNWALAELVEAAVRSDAPGTARDAHRRLADSTRRSGGDWALGIQARTGALVTDGAEADDLYQESIDRLGRTRVRAELARTHLLYGEWLRRERRRSEARGQLRAAHGMLEAMGMAAFAERAGRELSAAGETARKRGVDRQGELTTQEYEIAKLAREGLTNPEIGSRLFISARTVEYHLSKVFTKLDITSRSQLDRALS